MIQSIFVLLLLTGAAFTYRLIKGPTIADRVIALSGMLLVGMGSIAAHAAHSDTGAFLPALVALALVGPISNGMIARFIERLGG